MSETDFIKLVHEMRILQNRYFATKNKNALYASKDMESKVDQIIKDKLSNQVKLF